MKLKWLIASLVFISLFIFLHSSPIIALRTHLFFKGHPVRALDCKFEEWDYDDELKKTLYAKNIKWYVTFNPPEAHGTGIPMYNWKVEKKGFLYFGSINFPV
ncbi:MAG: hypothetical protein K0S34_2477 [Bacillales bacterium]|jgi:hypothetical protein|nr:hypothetical protein [Bacillales bacterium]